MEVQLKTTTAAHSDSFLSRPRLEGTLNDFDRAIDWMLQTDHEDRLLEEAVLGVVGGLDKPGSPAGEAKQAFHGDLFGRTSDIKKTFRDRVLETSMADLKRVTETYLKKRISQHCCTYRQTGRRLRPITWPGDQKALGNHNGQGSNLLSSVGKDQRFCL